MTDPIAETARAAGHRLSDELGPAIAADVEAALHARERAQRPEQYIDPVSLGSLIVSAATLAWTVYQDLKTKTPQPAPDVIARTIRLKLREADHHTAAEQDRVIEIVVDETTGGQNR